ncbi:hypothetical protein BD309DRAFT_969145, partial [Dichomitus squalens]
MLSFLSDLDDSSASKAARFIYRLARFIYTMDHLTLIESIKRVFDVYTTVASMSTIYTACVPTDGFPTISILTLSSILSLAPLSMMPSVSATPL